MKFQVDEAEYIGLLRIKSVVEAALKTQEPWTSEVGYAQAFKLIQLEVAAYYKAVGLQVPDWCAEAKKEKKSKDPYKNVTFPIHQRGLNGG